MTDAALLSAITQLTGAIEALRSDMAGRQRGRLARKDRDLLAVLLPVVARHIGDRLFTVNELLEHARLPVAVALLEALALVGESRSIGRLLLRGSKCDVDGYRITRAGTEAGVAVWVLLPSTG